MAPPVGVKSARAKANARAFQMEPVSIWPTGHVASSTKKDQWTSPASTITSCTRSRCNWSDELSSFTFRIVTAPVRTPLPDLRFTGLIAHHFLDVAEPSILFDVHRAAPAWVVENWAALFDERKNFGWPTIAYVDRAYLLCQLHLKGVQGFRVIASCGLDGFVLASDFEYRERRQEAEFL